MQVILRLEEVLRKELVFVWGEVSSSRYAEPETEGVRPVWRSSCVSRVSI